MEEAGIKTAASFIVMRCCTRNGNSLSMKDMVSVNMSLETIREETERITNTDMKHRIQSSLDNIFSIINKGGCDNGSVEDYK